MMVNGSLQFKKEIPTSKTSHFSIAEITTYRIIAR
jgi:hypothetical protein